MSLSFASTKSEITNSNQGSDENSTPTVRKTKVSASSSFNQSYALGEKSNLFRDIQNSPEKQN